MTEHQNYGSEQTGLPLINVIVPVYGVEACLEKCVGSLLCQTYSRLRVILVDDGSPDKCPQICDGYAAADSRVIVMHRENGGLSAARNSGLDLLYSGKVQEPGEYIAFVDSDDYVAPDYLETLYNLLISTGADIAQCGHYIVFSQSRLVDKNRDHTVKVFNRTEALESLCYNGVWDVTAWNKLYKIELLRDIRFPEGRLFEDTAVSYLIANNAEKLSVNMAPKYYYVQRYTSTVNSTEWKEYKYQFLTAGDEMADWIAANYPSLAAAGDVKRVFVRLSTLSQMANSGHEDAQRVAEMRAVIKRYRARVLKDPKAAKRDKLGIIAISLGWPFYKFVWRAYYKFVRRK